ncbi:hypothetical protein K439DRAFT_313384 [Ramaria rubella]|nr:hypothetical protein K439DRAFT_313384 [Ramaria rubella]
MYYPGPDGCWYCCLDVRASCIRIYPRRVLIPILLVSATSPSPIPLSVFILCHIVLCPSSLGGNTLKTF